ncbi:fused DSP-PTPase phosphatase/NAD kinase-like protein [Pseudidiomarina insulisalsae]|uniref:Serine/threonine protein phosphatase n=1 Tax=Pseudidiomarina insulisalsae TaxID=575789 RepID=A0A432YQP0_9GAMM|nr:sulfur transferase domain-containing protein [Pseudidiomarina insulisalsae]RUO63569.1 serine/threonine protein phosphatase [Pseudidiomarina insulisalsae]
MKLVNLLIVSSLALGLLGCTPEKADETPPMKIAEGASAIYNFAHPAPNHLVGGQPEQDEVAALADSGVDAIINLRSHAEMTDIPEAQWATANQIAYFHIPVSGAEDLNRETVRVFHETMQHNQDKTLFMHCASSNRVGALMALRAAWYQDVSAADALELGERYGLTSLRERVEELLNN